MTTPYIVLDLPSTIEEASLFSLTHADRNFLVVDCQYSSIQKVARFLQGMRHLKQLPEVGFFPAAILDKTTVVLNSYDSDSAVDTTALARAFDMEVRVTLPVLPDLVRRTDLQPFFMAESPGSELTLRFVKFVNTFTQESIKIDDPGGGWWKKRPW